MLGGADRWAAQTYCSLSKSNGACLKEHPGSAQAGFFFGINAQRTKKVAR